MELSKKIGEMEYDGLITDTTPPTQVRAGTIGKVSEATTLGRGTILAKSEAGTLSILSADESAVADCILCDDTEVGTGADVVVTVYTAGCFDPDKCAVADGYALTESDKDELRKRGIVFKAAAPAD
jgi:hypothetical protein